LELASDEKVKNILVFYSFRDRNYGEANMFFFFTSEAIIIANETFNGGEKAKYLYYLQNIK
jgi:hypothetical protein